MSYCQCRLLAQKLAVEDELASVQEDLLFVRSQLQNKSAKVLDLENLLEAQVSLVNALQGEVEALREEMRTISERSAMIQEDLPPMDHALDAVEERWEGELHELRKVGKLVDFMQ